MSNYLDWIDQQIDELQREIVKLTLARDVIVRANKELHSKTKEPRQLQHKKATRRARNLTDAIEVRAAITKVFKDDPVAKKPGIIAGIVLQQHPEWDKKKVWNQLYLMTHVHHTLLKSGGFYALLQEAPDAAAA